MKRIFIQFSLVVAVTAMLSCASEKEAKNQEEVVATETKTETPASVDVIAQGEALVKSNDCKTCHHPINKIIGPAHTDVAKKYDFTEANVKMLAEKIIKGGTGVWGEIPMSAHPNLSTDDAEKMARYVLSLDGEKEH